MEFKLQRAGDLAQLGRDGAARSLVVDEAGSVCVFVVKVTGAAARPGLPALAAAAIGVAARAGLPIYELVGDLRRFAASESAVNLGLSLLRISTRDSRVEILNAGMPAIIRLLPGEAPTLYQSRSGPVGNRFAEVYPYELMSLVWGSAWLLTSDDSFARIGTWRAILEGRAAFDHERVGSVAISDPSSDDKSKMIEVAIWRPRSARP